MTSETSHDRWVDHNTYTMATYVAGYRWVWTNLTSSFQLQMDQVLSSSTRRDILELNSLEPDLDSDPRRGSRMRFALYAGVAI